MKFMKVLILALLTALLLNACAGGQEPKKSTEVFQPEWWRIQGDDENLYTFGFATNKSETMSFDAARANAMAEAAQYVETEVQPLVKTFEKESGVVDPELLATVTKVIKEISKSKFSGTFVSKQQTYLIDTEMGQRYKTYVRISIPRKTINKNVVNNIRSEEALYNQFMEAKAFQELEEEVNNY